MQALFCPVKNLQIETLNVQPTPDREGVGGKSAELAARVAVDPSGGGVDAAQGDFAEVGAFREETSNQAVGVFVRTALPA